MEEFGAVLAGSVVQREIPLTVAPADFSIETVTSSCGCAIATFDENSKAIQVKWKIPNESGMVSKQIRIVGNSERQRKTITLNLSADARKQLAFEQENALWSVDLNSQNPEKLTLKVCNNFEDMNLHSAKAYIELDSVNARVTETSKLHIPIAVSTKEAIAVAPSLSYSFGIWTLELSVDLMRKLPDTMRSIDVVFEAIDGTGKSHQVHCDVTVRRGSKLVTRIVSQDSSDEIIVDLFVKLPPDQWSWSDLDVRSDEKRKVLDFSVDKKSDYYGRIKIKTVGVERPNKIDLSITGEKFLGSATLELRK
jgi:hypothetical protein